MVHQPERRRQALEQLLELTTRLSDGMEVDAAGRGLTLARAEVIWTLHHRGRLRQRDLAEALGVSPRNVTGLVDALEETGFATRAPHPTDRRAILVELTELGTALGDTLAADHEDFARFLFAGLSDGQLTQLLATVGGVLVHLRSPAYADVRAVALQRWSARRAAIPEPHPAPQAPPRSA